MISQERGSQPKRKIACKQEKRKNWANREDLISKHNILSMLSRAILFQQEKD